MQTEDQIAAITKFCNGLVLDYTNSLSAMYTAESFLGSWLMPMDVNSLPAKYWDNLIEVCTNSEPEICHVHASARQRAEAFLKTIGKWVE